MRIKEKDSKLLHLQAQPVIDFISNYTDIHAKERSAMIKAVKFSSHDKNDVLIQQGKVSGRIAFITKGSIRSYYSDEHDAVHTIGFAFENEPLVAAESFTRQTPSGTSAAALEPTDLLWTSHAEFFDFLKSFPKYETALRIFLSEHLAMEGEQSKLLRIASSRERYNAFCKMRPEVIKRVPLKYIASYLGMALETLSRIRAGKL